ncbi:MAG: hypothetical protein AAF965_13265 [Pseudomonadota bacterium]
MTEDESRKDKPEATADKPEDNSGATAAVNKIISTVSSTAASTASDVTEELSPHAQSLFAELKETALSVPKMGERVMIGLVFGVAALALLIAHQSWLSYAAFILNTYEQVIAGFISLADNERIIQVQEAFGTRLYGTRPFISIMIFVPLAIISAMVVVLALKMAVSGGNSAIDDAINAVRKNILRIALCAIPFALFAYVGSVASVVDVVAAEMAGVRRMWQPLFNIASLAPERQGVPISSGVLTAFVESLQWRAFFFQAPLFILMIFIIATRFLPAINLLSTRPDMTWKEMRTKANTPSFFRGILQMSFLKTLGIALGFYILARILLGVAFTVNMFLGAGIGGWILRLAIAIPITAVVIALIAALAIIAARLARDFSRTPNESAET